MNREEFIAGLSAEFPEVVDAISKDGTGLLHCEMAVFRRVVEGAMDNEQFWAVEKYLRYLEACFTQASAELENAIWISFLEDFALGKCTPSRLRAVRERMPQKLRDIVFQHDKRWS